MTLREQGFAKVRKGASGDAPCKKACPAGVDIPRWLHLASLGEFEEALKVIRENNPFPSICGHVCPRFCEARCQRQEADNPVAINALERFVAERASGNKDEELITHKGSGKRVAVVGSGPAGLTAAYYLAKLGGHSVTVFESLPKAGGMMRVGIPRYRLPEEVLDQELERILRLGINIRTNTKIESVDGLFDRGNDVVLLAMGAHQGVSLDIPGEDIPGVIQCLPFLKDVSLSKQVRLGNRVGIIGGGNTAIDAARTALRLGAKQAKLIYRRSRAEMPADGEQIDEALEEGVETLFLAAPFRLFRKDNAVNVECKRMELREPDHTGRRLPVPVSGSEFSLEFDTLIIAIGETPNIPERFGVRINQGSRLDVDVDALTTGREGVFAAGDVVTGTTSVIEAIAAGRRAAAAIDKYLGGSGKIEETLTPPEEEAPWSGFDEDILDIGRSPTQLLPVTDRVSSFDEVKLGWSKESALTEAKRCLRCDQSVFMDVDIDKCMECHCCQLICSFVYQGNFNLGEARIIIDLDHDKIGWNDDCVGGCSLCTDYCPTEAIRPSGQS